jgi:CubicO group peptidase (beta-lactamase class C family)
VKQLLGSITLSTVLWTSAAARPAETTRDYWPTTTWRTLPPEQLGMNGQTLEELRQHVARRLPHIRSVLIVRRGYIVFEDYSRGLTADDLHEVASITKSVTSATVGLALADGSLRSVDQSVLSFFPDQAQRLQAAAYADVTLRHLLTLTTGLRWREDHFRDWLEADNQIEFALSLPSGGKPGQRFDYNTPSTHLLSAIVQRATGKTLAMYSKDALFAPLGISRFRWRADRQGHSLGGVGLELRSRDLAKLGLLYVSGGIWENRQLLPKAWIQVSTVPHSKGGPPEDAAYGFLWWIAEIRGRSMFFAGGFGGQYLAVVPQDDIVIVITSNLQAPHRENRSLIADFILRAVDP